MANWNWELILNTGGALLLFGGVPAVVLLILAQFMGPRGS
jgi:hypothetical protein